MRVFCLSLTVFLTIIALPAYAADAAKESTFDRVMRTNTIRCGYTLWDPVLTHDANTNSYGGVAYDLMNEVAERSGLKVEWVEESPIDTMLQGMQTNRYDMVCFPLYILGTRARAASFSVPIYYTPIYLVARANDARFDKDSTKINDPKIKLAVIEGEATALVGAKRFPKATIHSIPQIQGYGFVLKDVAIGKADVTISDQTSVDNFNKMNSEKLKIIPKPFMVNAIAFPLAQDEKLKGVLDAALSEVLIDGWLENLLQTKYPDYYHQIMMPSTPYREVSK